MTRKLSPLRRWLVLRAGIYLTGLPTYYAIVAVGLTDKKRGPRRHVGAILFAVWVAIAVLAGYLALSSDLEILDQRVRLTRRSPWQQRANAKYCEPSRWGCGWRSWSHVTSTTCGPRRVGAGDCAVGQGR